MTRSGSTLCDTATSRPRLLTGPVARLLLTDLAAMSSFYLLLSVVPLYSTDRGIGGLGAGLSTGVLMFASVAAELVTPRLAARIGYRRLLMVGLVLLGAPALALNACTSLVPLMALCVIRGLGFAIIVVGVGALAAETILPSVAVRASGCLVSSRLRVRNPSVLRGTSRTTSAGAPAQQASAWWSRPRATPRHSRSPPPSYSQPSR